MPQITIIDGYDSAIRLLVKAQTEYLAGSATLFQKLTRIKQYIETQIAIEMAILES